MEKRWNHMTSSLFYINMASQMRFERTTFRLGGECSILLSYRDIYSKNPYFSRLFGLPGKDRCSFWTLFGLADPSIFSSNFEGDFANEHDILSSVLAKPVKSERRVELQARNEFFKISLLNISLGGECSILLSYWDNCAFDYNIYNTIVFISCIMIHV